nr:PREDICTED: proliferation marker protein Ki-67 [Rhinolophus sinicus]
MGPTGHLVTIKRSGVDGPHFPLSLSTCLFGRSTECDIRIQLPIVSKQHCKIEIKEQKAILFNFSSTYPTQLNGSAIDEPVQLKHGDVITIIDRSFRYEEESHQNGSKSTEFPGQRHEQASPRRVSTSGFYSDPDGKVQDPKACSKLTEESVSGRPLAHVWEVGAAPTVSHASEEPVARETPSVHLSHLPGDDDREAAGPTAGDAKDVSSVPAMSGNGQLPTFPSIQCLENSEENESPFRELYESMKEKLDRRSEKENVLRSRRKSGSRSHSVAENESAGGSQDETPRLVSPKSRRTSGRSSQSKADPASAAQPSVQTEEKGAHAGPVQTPKVTVSPSVPRREATETGTPGLCSHPSFTPKRRSGGRSVIRGDEPVNLDDSGESSRVENGTLLPRKSLTRNQTPTKLENADHVGNTPGKVLSKKRRRSSSVPANVDVLTETETQKQTALAPLLIQVERKMPDGALGKSEPLGAPGGQRCPGSPGLRSIDVSNFGDSTNMTEGLPLKRRRVSFGGHLRPELFDENLPPNTPLKRGETPMKRRSLVTHTAATVLKKIIKEQSQPSGNEDSSSETHLGVTAQNVFPSSPARNPVKTPAANDKRRRSSERSSASSGGTSPQQTETPKRGGRRSSSGPSRRTSVDRSQQEILQLIHSKRRSGASEANLIVAKSWADVVKLSAKQTQTKVVKHGPRRQLNKRQRRINTPKKPTSSVHNEFSTGHANSPCTIVVGKAHIEKVNVPARPYRMLNNFMFNRKIDFNEDLSGLTEMFKTPAKEKPQVRSLCPITFSNSEDLHRVPKPEEKPLLCTPENYGDNVFPSTQNVQEQMSDKRSASPALRRHSLAVNENMKTLLSEAEPPKVESSTDKFRRSMELRNTQVPGAACENKDEEANAAENILGRCLRKTREEKLEEEMKESERTFETCEKNIESKENSEKMIAVKRSRKSSEMKYAQRADLSTPKKLQEIEPKKELVDIHSLGIPGHTKEPVDVENRTAVMNCESPESDSVSTPVKMNVQIKLPSQKVNVGQLSALGRSTQTPGETTHSHREQVGDDKIIELFKETPEQKSDPTENVTGSRRRSRTPKRKVQPLEDLAGFRELFQTPNRSVEPVVDDKTTKIPHKSPKPEPVTMPGDDKDIRAFKETPEQKLDHMENVTGSRRRSRTLQRKVQPLEDMAGFKELFQTPKHTVEPVTDEKTKIPCKSPQAEASLRKPTRTSRKTTRSQREPGGDEKDVTVFKESAEQKPDPAKNVTRSKRKPRTPEEKAQPLEDLAGLEEPFQTSDHTDEPVTVVKTTRMHCQSSQPGPGILPASKKRRLKAAPGKADGEEEPTTLRKPTRASRKTTRSHREPDDDKDVTIFKESAEQKPDPANNVTRSKRKPRTPKENTQTLEDLAGLKEPFHTPNHTVEPVTDDKTKIPCKSPQAEAVMPIGRKSCLKAPPAKADIEVEPLSLRKPTRTSRKTTRSRREPDNDGKDVTVFKESAEQKPDPAKNVTRSKRKPRIPEEKAQPLEDLAGLEEPFQTSDHTDEPVTVVKTTRMHCQSSQPGPGILPASKKRQLKAAPGKADGEEEPTALRKPTRTGRSTRAHRESVDGPQDVIVCEGTAKPKRGPAENATGSKRLLRTRKEKAPPLEVPAGCPELLQTADPDKEHGNDAENVKRTPTQTPDRREPVKTSRRVLRAPRVKPMDDLAGSRDPVKSPSESSVSQSSKRKRGKEGTVTGRERLGSTTCPQDTAPEMPLQKRQRTAPSERCEPPAPLVTKKKGQRLLAGRTEPVEELPNSMRTETQEQKAEAVASPAKGISLRSRPPKKTSGAEQRRPEFLESAEKTNVKRNEKKAPNTSQEVTLQHREDGVKNSTSGGQVRERRMCLRSGRQSTKHLSGVTEEKAWEKSVETHVTKKTQEKKEGSKRSGSVGLRPKKMTVCPTGDPLEKESKQRVTRSVKRSTENIKKEDDNGCIKKLRTRRHRGSEDI